MRSLLFYIPHELAGIPLLGWGWLLLALLVGFIAWALWQARQGRLAQELAAGLPVWLIAAAIVALVLPMVEARWPDGTPIGVPVRGYGVLVLVGLLAGIGLTTWRGAQVGVPSEVIVSLGFWMMIGGVIGARTFFVIQYWDEFQAFPPGQRWWAILKLTEGGLVIYGGMIGGVIAGLVYCLRYRLPVLSFADLIAPGFLIGQALGRIGCLMNGCCFGGVCTADLPAIQFPQGSPPYAAQLESGRLLGIIAGRPAGGPGRIESVQPGSLAEHILDAKPGMPIHIQPKSIPPRPGELDPARTWAMAAQVQLGDREKVLLPAQLPAWSLPVHPSQIYSALDSLLLCVLILCLQPWVTRDGQAFFAAVFLHGIARFTLELIRSDESGQFGTYLTISQWISLGGMTLATIGFGITSRLARPRSWQWQ